jgi:Spy/CpxP family protein refolding chaperone
MTGMKKPASLILLVSCLASAASALAEGEPARAVPPVAVPLPDYQAPHRPFAEMSSEQRERWQQWREERQRQRYETWREMSVEERHQLRRDIREAGRLYRRGPR